MFKNQYCFHGDEYMIIRESTEHHIVTCVDTFNDPIEFLATPFKVNDK